jgi:orotate phosphoribosyltransferase-like protein
VVPDLVFAIPDDLNVATVGAYTVVPGSHTSTNAIFTVTTSKVYRVVAISFAGTPVATALTAESGNKAAVFFHKKF